MRRYVLLLLGAAALLWTVATALTQVQPGERAVVRRFGRLLDESPGPGLYSGWPWGIERVERVAVGRVLHLSVGWTGADDESDTTPAGQLLTGDQNLVNVKAEIAYRVREAQVARYVLQRDRAEALLARAAESALAEWVAGRTVDDVLRGKAALGEYLLGELPGRLAPYELGIEVEQVSVTRLLPPDQVKDAFDRVSEAETAIRTRRNQAEQKAGQEISRAASEGYRLKVLAQADAAAEKVQAQAEADSFLRRLAQYRTIAARDPKALDALWLDEMTRLYASMRAAGRIDVLDHYLSSEGLNITQFPLQTRKK